MAEAERKNLPYDLLLMDWKMPVLDGIDTVERVQTERLANDVAMRVINRAVF